MTYTLSSLPVLNARPVIHMRSNCNRFGLFEGENSELQIRGDIEDNSKTFFLVSQ